MAIAPAKILPPNSSDQSAESWWQRWQHAQTLVTDTTANAVRSLTQAGETAKTQLLTATDEAIEQISAAATQAVNRIQATTDRETQALSNTAHQATTTVVEATARAKASMTEVTQTTIEAVDRVNIATADSIQRLTEATDQVMALNQRWQSVGMGGSVIDAAQTAIASSAQTWLEAHPLLGWLIVHPIILIITILLAIWLSWGLFRAIAQLSERLWIGLLRAPFQLLRLVWQLSTRLWRRASPELQPAPLTESNKQERLATLLARLEAMRREQDELLKELQTILKD